MFNGNYSFKFHINIRTKPCEQLIDSIYSIETFAIECQYYASSYFQQFEMENNKQVPFLTKYEDQIMQIGLYGDAKMYCSIMNKTLEMT